MERKGIQRRLRVVTATLQPDQVRRLDEIAAAQRRTRSFVLRDIVDAGLATLRSAPQATR